MPSHQRNSNNDWLQPPADQQGLKRYAETIRERLWIIILATLVGTALAIAYVVTAEEVYEAEAELLISPIPADDAILASIGLFIESNDPSLDVETASRVIDGAEVAEAAATELGNTTGEEILDETEVAPIPESNVVVVTASASTAIEAAELANAFADAAVVERTAELQARIDDVLPRLRDQLDAARTGGVAAETLAGQVAELEVLGAGDSNPTLRVETEATTPESPVWPKPALTVVGGVLGGAALGLAIAFLLRVLDPRLRREEQLRALYRLPILARVPQETSQAHRPLTPERLTPVARESYRTLRSTLGATGRGRSGPKSVVVTGSGSSEGKTTTAINLAVSLALSGQRVILIESDLRRPAIAGVMGLKPDRGVVSVLIRQHELEDALLVHPAYGPNLRFLLADRSGSAVAELLSLPAAENLLERAEQIADYVIVDAPPLTDVIDALPLARRADAVLLIAHLNRSRLTKLKELGELLASNGVRPVGFVLLGVSRSERQYYQYLGHDEIDRPRLASMRNS